jgi:hypothetical protein
VLKNIDDLHAIIDKNYRRRMADLPLVKKTIMREMSDFLVWYYSLAAAAERAARRRETRRGDFEEIVRRQGISAQERFARSRTSDAQRRGKFCWSRRSGQRIDGDETPGVCAERGLKLKHKYIIGSRGSQLALWQTEHVKTELERRFATQAAVCRARYQNHRRRESRHRAL